MSERSSRSVLAVLIASVLSSQVYAHHSGAMFDYQKSKTLAGTVKEFQWTNPHCWIQLLVPAEHGTVEWSIEMATPSSLFQAGWRPHTLKPGDKIVVVINLARDGTNTGLIVSAVREDGRPLGTIASATHAASVPSREP